MTRRRHARVTADQLETSDFFGNPIRWLTGPVNGELDGLTTISWEKVQEVADAAREKTTFEERSLKTEPPWFNREGEVRRLAIVDVVLDRARDVADLLGFVVEPTSRLDIPLTIVVDRPLDDLDGDDAFIEKRFGYAYSLDRLRWAVEHRGDFRSGPTTAKLPKNPSEELPPLDATQREAVGASDGVVQVIAPAGSGKTTVLIERVREIVRRSEIRPKQILCLTFNKTAKEVMEKRLPHGLKQVKTYTYHGLGCSILIEAKLMPWKLVMREGKEKQEIHLGRPNADELKELIEAAKEKAGQGWRTVTVPDVLSRLSDIKLGRLQCAKQYAADVAGSEDPYERIMAEFYMLYEQAQIRAGEKIKPVKGKPRRRIDFDDQILWAVRLLRHDSKVRRTRQGKYTHVLVDEYQDIEPAQELLVRMLAAPQDQLFCVGDEDQTLYAFRRASVERILDLDQLYPDLQRFSLGCNYRCPPDVVRASRMLIGHNERRFRDKTITWDERREDKRTIVLRPVARPVEGAREIAVLLEKKMEALMEERAKTLLKGKAEGLSEEEAEALPEEKARDHVAVLARTVKALRPVAMASIRRGVPVDGPRKLFAPSVALDVLLAHLRLALYPTQATPVLVAAVCEFQHWELQPGGDREIADALRAGLSFAEAFQDQTVLEAAQEALGPATLFEKVARQKRLAKAVRILREDGGLDAWALRHASGDGEIDDEEADDDAYGVDQFAFDDLEQAWSEAREVDAEPIADEAPSAPTPTPRERLIERLVDLAKTLNGRSDKTNGIKLRTIHSAKGSEWPQVIVVGCDEGLMPHSRATMVTPEEARRGEGIEAERRIAYVAFTRAKQELHVYYTPSSRSPFLVEAGLLPQS